MPLEPPARIAILGAGPIGLEAALYARFLGYQVDVFERGGGVAGNVRDWGHVGMFSPFGMNASPLAIAAIEAQDATWQRPADDELLTGHEFVEQYLAPLASTDLVAESVHPDTQVVAVGREAWLKNQLSSSRENAPFCILTQSPDGSERTWTADAVLDTTGTYGNHNWLGPGCIPAIGERTAARHIEYGLPDVLGRERERYAGRHTLVVGTGYSAATSVVGLAELARQEANTRLTWVTRRAAGDALEPISCIPNDRLAARQLLAETANRLARAETVTHVASAVIEEVIYDEVAEQFHIRLQGTEAMELSVDRMIANVGYRPDMDIFRELQVHTCYASEGPMKLAAALLGQASRDCLDQTSCGPQSLVTPEPNFFILGAKSYGRSSNFLLSVGLEQIRDVFTILGDNPELDLYRTIGYRRQQ